jgi:hypothetical protein
LPCSDFIAKICSEKTRTSQISSGRDSSIEELQSILGHMLVLFGKIGIVAFRSHVASSGVHDQVNMAIKEAYRGNLDQQS